MIIPGSGSDDQQNLPTCSFFFLCSAIAAPRMQIQFFISTFIMACHRLRVPRGSGKGCVGMGVDMNADVDLGDSDWIDDDTSLTE
jgi:hypothetical protein